MASQKGKNVTFPGSDKYSDLKLKCGGKVFNVHKVIVCTQSEVLAAAVDGTFKESTTNEVEVTEFDAQTLYKMIDFMYNKDYQEQQEIEKETEPGNEAETESETEPENKTILTARLLEHVKVNAIADYYFVSDLKALANAKIMEILEKQFSCEAFVAALNYALKSTTDKALREILGTSAALHIDEFMQDSWLGNADFFLSILVSKLVEAAAREREGLENIIQDQDSALKAEMSSHEIQKSCREAMGMLTRRQCRNGSCNAEFPCYFEKISSSSPRWILRCSRCKCKHV
ncbi:hypothetical protein P152DRAFT_397143 [Eremomyces bilateralis CBS 781.70]|uniref:BTB domain-containing protein n=1 Tax=Eremomyces bilateralis CBS 781.70 TaxID=1392243 RepID=A0A6G1G4D5_9PEZI|nr:uncharacterized protein P152DRAFT_397143 [Eremomyces bilateralis CBS 781.70]KAF1812689.1 hypothetical protein P152DRAFT_397143 [Eremomyces bilateralis CBS 781.70]